MNSEIKLKNCPFCGGEAYLGDSWGQAKVIQCSVCGCATRHFLNKLDAVETWNKRVPAPGTSAGTKK